MSDIALSHRLGPPLLAALLAAGSVQAQIVTDGSVGPKVSLRGGEIEIGANLGTRTGDNLFHSFEKFGIATGQTATFTGPDTVKNVISRVTGGEISTIDGTLASRVGQADLYFLNPAGVMFGPNARLDVPGSFHVSSAHELRFDDGVSFSALDKTGSGLTVAAPEAFGFLDRPPGRIRMDQSELRLNAGKALSLVGGDLDIVGGASGTLSDPGGTVTLTSLTGAGQSRVSDGAVDAARQGTIRLSNRAAIDVSGNGGGTIRLRGGVLVAENSARLAANSTGERDHTGIIDVQAQTMRLDNSVVEADAHSSGRGGTIMIAAGDLQVLNGGLISANTFGAGAAGTVSARADRLFISRDGATDTGIVSRNVRGSTGAGGRVEVTAGDLQVLNGGVISATTFGAGAAGTVIVRADRLLISRDRGPNSSELVSNANAGGAGGRVEVTAGDLQMLNGGRIRASTFGAGDAGTVIVRADRLLISDDVARGPTGRPADTGIFSITGGGSRGAGGRIEVTAGDLQMRTGGQISVNTSGFGDAGTVSVTTDRLLISHGGAPVDTGIVSRTVRNLPGSGAGGRIEVTAGDLQVRTGGVISATTFGTGDAGTVSLRADRLLISGDGAPTSSNVVSDANNATVTGAGAGGRIEVTAGDLQVLNGGQIRANTFGAGAAGTVSVTADRLLISGDGAPAFTGIASSTRGKGAGGQVDIQAPTMLLREGGTVTTESYATGPGGNITITAADMLRLDNAAILTKTVSADGGNVTLKAGRLFDLHNSTVTTSVAGGTGSGGNIVIDPPLMVLDRSRIEANAFGGPGGTITIRAGQLIRTPDSMIEASSARSVSGTITITAPNTDVAGSLIVLPETFFDASSQLRVACAARGGRPASSFAPGGRGGLPPDPGAPLAASSFGQPLEQQTATGSPTALTPRPPQATKPITVAGTPQPVLGSPRLTCRG